MKNQRSIWVQVHPELPWNDWWTRLVREYPELAQLPIEKWVGSELSWAALVDALFSFSLFHPKKILVVHDADKILKKDKNWSKSLEKLKSAPHHLVMVSEDPAPKAWVRDLWKAPEPKESDDRAVFRWIDAVHAAQLDEALVQLDQCFQSDQPALVCLQLLSRHFRLGRMVLYAREKGLDDAEIAKTLKLPAFALQKWKSKESRNIRSWMRIFEQIQEADLLLKSNQDAHWILRQLTIRLVRHEQQRKRPEEFQKMMSFRKPSLFSQPLSPIEPSFS